MNSQEKMEREVFKRDFKLGVIVAVGFFIVFLIGINIK